MNDGTYPHATVVVKGGKVCDVLSTPVVQYPPMHCCSTAGKDPSQLPPPLEKMGTNTVALLGLGTNADKLNASAFLSSQADNAVSLKTNGLFAKQPIIDKPALATYADTTLATKGLGTSASPMLADAILAPSADNIMKILAAGLYISDDEAHHLRMNPDPANLTSNTVNWELTTKISYDPGLGLTWGGNGTEADPLTLKEVFAANTWQSMGLKTTGSGGFTYSGFYAIEKYCFANVADSIDYQGSRVNDQITKNDILMVRQLYPSLDTQPSPQPPTITWSLSSGRSSFITGCLWWPPDSETGDCGATWHDHGFSRQFSTVRSTMRPFSSVSLTGALNTNIINTYTIGCMNQHIAVSATNDYSSGKPMVHGYAFGVPEPNKNYQNGDIQFEVGVWNTVTRAMLL